MAVLDLLGIGSLVRASGALLALVAMFGGIVLYYGWQEEDERARRLLKAEGDILAFTAECRMRSSDDSIGSRKRSLWFKVPCDMVDSRQAQYPDRDFSVTRTDLVTVAYATARGIAVEAKAKREDLGLKRDAAVGDRISFYYDPQAPRTRLLAQPPSAVGRWLGYGLGWSFVLLLGVLATALGGYAVLDRNRAYSN
jgi:hypothetical protein